MCGSTLTTHGPHFWAAVARTPGVRSVVNRWIINSAIYTMATRPPALSTMSPYTSWESLRDRTFSARHLPPVDPSSVKDEPSLETVTELFKRTAGEGAVSRKSTLLFPMFAQWFVDGFLRTDPNDPLQETQSTHEIDLSQLYGQTRDVTNSAGAAESGGPAPVPAHQRPGSLPPYYFGEQRHIVKKRIRRSAVGVSGLATARHRRSPTISPT